MPDWKNLLSLLQVQRPAHTFGGAFICRVGNLTAPLYLGGPIRRLLELANLESFPELVCTEHRGQFDLIAEDLRTRQFSWRSYRLKPAYGDRWIEHYAVAVADDAQPITVGILHDISYVVASAKAASRLSEANLTPRELEVLRSLSIGQTPKKIALELQISIKTAQVHISRIRRKLGIESAVDYAKYAQPLDRYGTFLQGTEAVSPMYHP